MKTLPHSVPFNGRTLLLFESPRVRWKTLKEAGGDKSKFARLAKLAPLAEAKRESLTNIVADAVANRRVTVYASCACAVLLMMDCGIRCGNEDSAEGYVSDTTGSKGQFVQTYGVTTLTTDHVVLEHAGHARLEFVGKKGVAQEIRLSNLVVSQYIRNAYWARQPVTREPQFGARLLLGITESALTKFVKRKFGGWCQVKDLRTLAANAEASRSVRNIMERKPPATTKTALRADVKEVLTDTAKVLGNTPGVCKKSYVDQRLLEHLLALRQIQVQ